nr:phospholipase/carboxylesterase precursor [Aureimonas sp. AU22]
MVTMNNECEWGFMMRTASGFLGAVVALACIATASAEPFAPFKDGLFSYPEPVASLDGGQRLDVPYSEARDIDDRDDIPERRVKRRYVDLKAIGRPEDREIATPGGPLRYATVGSISRTGPILVFVHGRNGDRRLGLNDWSFGGNFNRLKNLLVRNDGIYVTVDGGRLGDADAARIGTLLQQLKREHASSRLILACASMGGQICWSIASGSDAPAVDAMMLLGSDSSSDRFAAMRRAHKARMPLFLAHGTRDKVYAFDRQVAFYSSVRKGDPTYPIRFVGFEDGNHGTPIRMIDWRDALNWIDTKVGPSSPR